MSSEGWPDSCAFAIGVCMDMNKPLRTEMGLGNAERYEQVFEVIESGKIVGCAEAELIEHAKSLCVFHSHHVGQDQTSAALLLHHLLLSKSVSRVADSVELTEDLEARAGGSGSPVGGAVRCGGVATPPEQVEDLGP